MEKNIGKVILVSLPNTKRPQYRWIVKKREDGRYITRTPKIGVLLRTLQMKKNEDFGKETLLPIGSKPYIGMKTAKNKRKTKTKKKKKTKREHFHIRNK